jgi:hypothetical protein
VYVLPPAAAVAVAAAAAAANVARKIERKEGIEKEGRRGVIRGRSFAGDDDNDNNDNNNNNYNNYYYSNNNTAADAARRRRTDLWRHSRTFAGSSRHCCASPESCQECGPVSVRSRVLSCPKVSLGIVRPCPIRRPRFPELGARHTGHVFFCGRSNNIRAPGGRRTRPPSSAERASERARALSGRRAATPGRRKPKTPAVRNAF